MDRLVEAYISTFVNPDGSVQQRHVKQPAPASFPDFDDFRNYRVPPSCVKLSEHGFQAYPGSSQGILCIDYQCNVELGGKRMNQPVPE